MTLDAIEIDRAYQFFLNRTPPADKRPPFESMSQLFSTIMGSKEYKASDRSWKNDLPWPLRQVFVLPQARVIYCPIGKNGCSFLKAQMVRLSDAKDPNYILRDVHLLTDHVNTGLQLSDYPTPQAQAHVEAPDFMKFAVLRNPRDRMLSAWMEKFVLNRNERGNQMHTGAVVAAVQGQTRPDFHRSISFADFVRYMAAADPTQLDPHWRPQSLYLRGVDYTHLFDFDRINDAIDALEDWTGASLPRQAVNTTGSGAVGGQNTVNAYLLEPHVLDGMPRISRSCFFDETLDNMITETFASDFALLEKIRTKIMITPVLLCGGSGTRLWPLSRKSFPKQFAPLIGEESLFQASARRFLGKGFGDPLVVTADSFRFIVTEQLDGAGVEACGILIEPEGRNTAPAAVLAALKIMQDRPDGMLLLVPSDHAVANSAAFRRAVLTGSAAAEEGNIVTFGIKATRAETGYGWLQSGAETHPGVMKLERFIEKPDAARAVELLADDKFLWNAGVFLARADVLIEAFRTHAPEILAGVEAALAGSSIDLGFTRLDVDAWATVPEDSIDYAVMEKATNVSVVCFEEHWSDLGSWEAVWQESPKDEDGNAQSDNTTVFDCENTLLRSESSEIELVGIGLKNVVAVAMRDAVMVADLSESQNVKRAVETLKERGAKQAVQLPVDHRPWGWFETLILADRFQVKRIYVHPGALLSLQSHFHRSEHWIVVAGTARVTVGDEVKMLTENQSVYIPLGTIHRMENPGRVPMVLIEVQTGTYLGEDDIVRHEDVYART